ncbi:IQ calmodulin-binding motif containing protein [Lotmaria passim]
MQSVSRLSSNDNGVVTHWKVPPPQPATAASPATTSSTNTPASILSNLAFLQRMADAFEARGNYAECVRSAESALLLRQANAAIVAAALKARQQQQQSGKKSGTALTAAAASTPSQDTQAAAPCSTGSNGGDHPSDMVALTDKGDVLLPLALSQQAEDVVQRCNSYAVAALRRGQLDSAAFFLNRAMFLTDGEDSDNEVGELRSALFDNAGSTAITYGASDRWWWRRVLKQRQPPKQSPSGADHDAEDALALSSAGAAATTTTAIALRACFSSTPQDQQLRLTLRAATLNHLGCLEQRRGRLSAAVVFFRMAVRTAARLEEAATTTWDEDIDNKASVASTYLNLCTVLNAMGRHAEAVQACERVVPLLQQTLQEAVSTSPAAASSTAPKRKADDRVVASSAPDSGEARVATMLVVAYYNLGVSLERRNAGGNYSAGASDDGPQRAFQQAMQVSHAYRLVPTCCRSIEAVMQALRHPPTQEAHNDHSSSSSNSSEVDREARKNVLKQEQAIQAAATAAPTRPPRPPSQVVAKCVPTCALPLITPGTTDTAGPTCRPPQPPLSGFSPSPPSHPRPMASLTGSSNSPTTRPPTASFTASSAWTSPFAVTAPSPHPSSTSTPPAVLAPLPAFAGLHSASALNSTAPPGARTPPPLPPPAVAAHSSNSNSNSGGGVPGAAAPVAGMSIAATAPPGFLRPAPPRIGRASSDGAGSGAAAMSATAPRLSLLSGLSSAVNPLGRRTFGGMLPLPAAGGRGRAAASADAMGRAASGRGANSNGNGGIGGVEGGARSARGGLRDRLAAATSNSANASSAAAAGTNEMGRSKQPQPQRRSKRQKNIERRQQRETAMADAALAEKIYQQLISEKEKAEVERCRRAAVQIQRIWRGVLARTWVATLMRSAICLQRAVRRFLVKTRAEHARAAAEQARRRAEESARQEAACRVLQRRVRQFLRRLQIRREYRANQARLFYAARTIQRGYRAYCAQRAAQLAAQAEAHRREDEQRYFREKVAARRIQHVYLAYKTKRAELDAYQMQQRRIRSVVRIQAVVRGYLTRAWYAYYRVYRREQEVRSAAMQAKLTVVQSACRAICSAYYGQQRALQALLRMREVQQHAAAVKIQCMWRCHVAVIRRVRLQAEHDCRARHATRIQRWYRMRTQRRAFLEWRTEQQRRRAAARLQRWIRACWQAAKAREFAAYHAELLRRQQLQRLQARSVVVIQACANACVSSRLVASVRDTFERNDAIARRWQRVGRGFAARREMALERRVAYQVALNEKETARRCAAARVLQRAWRLAAAKDKVEAMRREVAAADVIARAYRVYRARVELAKLRAARQRQREDTAARRIQQAVRGFLYGRRAKEMDAYYRAEHHKKMRRLRQAEAAVMIQSQWRGYVTRKAVQEDRAAWQALSASAAVIQRAWKARLARRQLHQTLATRIEERNQDSRAALTVQCFWRKILAARRVAQLRQETQRRRAAASMLQSWWRMQLAQREFARLRHQRREEAALEVYYAIQWEKHATLVNAFLRQRESQVIALSRLKHQLIGLLTEEDRRRFLTRHEAATKIQALFRGHYERYYARGLRAQAREEQRRRDELLARQQRAAVTIQCGYRSAQARRALAALRQAEFDRVQASHADYLESADPSELVRELFWLNSTYQQREAAVRRKAEAKRRNDAAARIQRVFRCHRARHIVAAAHDVHQQERAARLLQDYWRHYRDVRRIKEQQRRQAAATLLQSHIRGWIVRRGWPLYRASIEAERQERVLVQDVLDHAAIVLQCFWRRVEAQRTVARLRQQQQAKNDARAQQEAAMVIQEVFRNYQRRKKMGF